jgi:flavorubredoxin/flavin reductase (DIM6/NTAB) family NADH-FMN oxidoreductase RutF
MSLSNVNVLEKRRLQTQTITSIAPDVTTIRSLDWDRDRFDIEFGLQNGTTYNSFIINADKLTIIDASHEKFKGLYLSAIKEHIDPSAIEYIIANHTEPDHSGLIPDLLDLAPNATVVGSKTCIIFLQNLVLRPFKSLVVKGGSTLDLGRGHLLEFVMAPNLHWPDTMFTLDHGAGILFTCDAFGMHYCSELLYDEDLGAIEPHYRFYYDCLMRPNCRSVITALKRIAEKDFSIIATGHGPLLRYNVAELLNKYETWSKQALEKQLATVAVLYVSDYGFSDRLSQTLARGLTKTNTGVEMMDLNVVDIQDMIECVSRCAGVVIMAPPSSGPANKAITTIYAAVKPKQPVVIAESYGGDDEPVDTIVQRFVALGISLALPPLRIKEIPNEATYQQFEEAGTDLGQLLSQKKSIEAKKAGMPINVAKAIARISGGLYVVTAAKGSSNGAMVASWVSQASFKPLGITIAVAKDRAIESLMQVGDTFVLNCLEDGNYAPLMKHFLKRFPPGADRFEGVQWVPAASNGSPILIDCIAYLECKVVKRMETNDHWIAYSHVSDGNVSKPQARTASHHRKIGNYY